MVFAKRDKIIEFLIFLFFILFPFGQIIRFDFGVIRIQPIDLVAIASCLFLLEKNFKRPFVFKYFLDFVYVLIFSFFFSVVYFREFYFVGLFYLIRVLAYLGFFLIVWNYTRVKKQKDLIFKSLISVAFVIGIFGWIQYFFYPDFTSFKVWGWDDHLFRLIGTFFDPTFTAIILVLGFFSALSWYNYTASKKKVLLLLFFLVTIAFTYARAAYVALFAGLIIFGWQTKNFKKIIIIGTFFFLTTLFLPRPAGEGVKLERLYSIETRLIDYKETFSLFKKSPLLGIGFNNLCLAKVRYLGETNTSSHACSGSDSSILLILATTGVFGLLIFVYLFFQISKRIQMNFYGVSLISSVTAILIHSQFVNSLFYPWIMGWILILTAISLRSKINS